MNHNVVTYVIFFSSKRLLLSKGVSSYQVQELLNEIPMQKQHLENSRQASLSKMWQIRRQKTRQNETSNAIKQKKGSLDLQASTKTFMDKSKTFFPHTQPEKQQSFGNLVDYGNNVQPLPTSKPLHHWWLLEHVFWNCLLV